MSDLEVGLLILLVVGVIASNLAVLKYSAKFKMTQFGKHHHDKKLTDKAPSEKKAPQNEANDKSSEFTSSNDRATKGQPSQSDKSDKS